MKHGDRVLLVSENRPEWAISYFGILQRGRAPSVPVDPALSEAEVVNIARRAEAKACLISEQAAEDFPGLVTALAEGARSTQVLSLAEAMSGRPGVPGSHRAGAQDGGGG